MAGQAAWTATEEAGFHDEAAAIEAELSTSEEKQISEQRKSTSRTLKSRSVDLRPTNRLAALGSDNARPCNPGMDALLNDGALEFREDTEHWKSAFPAGVLNLPRLYVSAQA
jgi:hypothetical protein